ncbi:hypothetical protein SAMN06265218_1351, partial [Fodinibius sediminis]
NDIIHAVGPGKEEEDLQSNILKTEEEE